MLAIGDCASVNDFYSVNKKGDTLLCIPLCFPSIRLFEGSYASADASVASSAGVSA